MELRTGRRARLITAALLLVAAVAAGAPGLALAAARKLNPGLALGGRVAPVARYDAALGRGLAPGYQLTPDGAAVVFLADRRTAGVFELFRAPAGGGAPARLSGALPPGGDVVEFAVDRAGRRVVYLADQREDERFELFSVPLAGGEPAVLNSFLAAGGDVTGFAISPDSTTVVFRADRIEDEAFDLFSAPIGGGAPDVRLNERAAGAGDVQPDFAISPDNQRALFRFNPLAPATFDLLSAPLTGGAPAASVGRLGVGQPGGTSVLDFAVSPDGTRVALRARSPAGGSANLYLAPATGSDVFFRALTALDAGRSVEAPPPSELAPGEQPPGDALPYAFTPDSATLVFIADIVDGLFQLHALGAASAGAASPTLLSPTVTGARDVTDFRIGPGGARVVFRAEIVDDAFELISVQPDGGSTRFLFPSFESFADVRDFAITPDGLRVVYTADFRADEQVELRSTLIDSSGENVTLSGPLAPDGDVLRFAAAAGGQRVVYSADQDVDGVVELYSVLAAGGAPARISATLATGGDVEDFVVSPTAPEGPVVYRADVAADEVFSLTSVPVAGPSTAGATLSDAAAVSGDVVSFALSPDGERAVYLADQQTDEVFELFGAPLHGGEPVRLSGAMAPGGDVSKYAVSPAGGRVVFLADRETDGTTELYSAPLAGGPVVKLSLPLPALGAVADFAVAPDGARVVYLASQERRDTLDLYSVPLAGGEPVRLSALAAGRAVRGFAVTPDGQRVVYLADQGEPEVFELFSVAVGGGTPAALNAPLPAGGDVAAFQVSPDSQRVAFIADQNTDETYEIYSVPAADGAVTRLNLPLPAGRDVIAGASCAGQGGAAGASAPLQISPDSERVVFCAGQDDAGAVGLYSAALAVGSSAVRLSPALGGPVDAFAIAADSARVVFRASDGAPGTGALLFSAPLAGGAEATRLNGSAPGQVVAFALSPDGRTAAFISADGPAGWGALFAAPVAGGAPSRRSGELPPGGGVASFQISPDGARLIFLAGPGPQGGDELFATLLLGDVTPSPLNAALPPGGGVRPGFRFANRHDVVFLAEQATDDVVELYRASSRSAGGLSLPLLRGLPPPLP